MNIQIVQDVQALKVVCKPCRTLEEGEKIAKTLLEVLKESKNGIGLAANQIGINKRVCVVNVNKPIVLINPEIVGRFHRISFNEGCLSFPGDYILTERYANFAVRSLNNKGVMYFSKDKDLLECVCAQHEIDHLDGITMHDRKLKGINNV